MLDHLVYAAPDVEAACDHLEQRLGIRPSMGGRFVAMGAYNRILSLGGGAYVEVIGPDPELLNPEAPAPFGIAELSAPRLVTWAAKASGLEERVTAAKQAGIDLGRVLPLSRELPDGSTLAWELTSRPPGGDDGVLLPFLIDWGGATHPSQTGAQGCQLVEFHGEHPDPDVVLRMLEAVGEPINVTKADEPGLVATIHGPKGQVELR